MAEEIPQYEDPFAGLGEDGQTTVVEPVKETPKAPVEDTRFAQLQNAVTGNELLTKVLTVPGVQDLLRAHQTGQKVKVVSEDEIQKTTVAADSEPDWEKMKDDPKSFSDYLVKRLVKDVEGVVESKIKGHVDPLTQEMNTIKGAVSEQTAKGVNEQIAAAKAKYSDWSEMLPAIREFNTKVGGTLSVEELYKSVKAISGSPLVSPKEVETERPTDSAARGAPMSKPKSYPIGRRGMKAALSDALATMDLEDLVSS